VVGGGGFLGRELFLHRTHKLQDTRTEKTLMEIRAKKESKEPSTYMGVGM